MRHQDIWFNSFIHMEFVYRLCMELIQTEANSCDGIKYLIHSNIGTLGNYNSYFNLIIYVGILSVYMVVNILLALFLFTGTIKHYYTLLNTRRKLKHKIKSAPNRSINNQTVSLTYFPSCSFLICFSPGDAVTFTDIYTRPCNKDGFSHVLSWFYIWIISFSVKRYYNNWYHQDTQQDMNTRTPICISVCPISFCLLVVSLHYVSCASR